MGICDIIILLRSVWVTESTLTTWRWSLQTLGRNARRAAVETPRPPPVWAAGTGCPMSHRGISKWPARSRSQEQGSHKSELHFMMACLSSVVFFSAFVHVKHQTLWSWGQRWLQMMWHQHGAGSKSKDSMKQHEVVLTVMGSLRRKLAYSTKWIKHIRLTELCHL